ncbi:MAG: hypothetical protein FJZ92_11140 [Chloroflexi bacterium]|nr:hypothetical protein [Chloroflexota bacterium]
MRRLRGGLTARMHDVGVRLPGGRRERVVLRRYIPEHGGGEPADARREYRTLEVLTAHGVPVPRPLLLDAEGATFGTPAMLMSRLRGRPRTTGGRDPGAWLAGLAGALAHVHRLTPRTADLTHLRPRARRHLLSPFGAGPGAVDSRDGRLERIERLLHERLDALAPAPPALVHNDYFTGNVVWNRGRVSGVVDWHGAIVGDPREDVAEIRIDLAIGHGLAVADAFAEAYAAAVARPPRELWWFDLFRAQRALRWYREWIPGLHDLGMTHVSATLAGRRLRAFVDRALAEGAGAAARRR